MSDEKSYQTQITSSIEKLIGTAWWDIIEFLYLLAKFQNSCIFLPIEFHPMSPEEYVQFTARPYGGLTSLVWDCRLRKNCTLRLPKILPSNIEYSRFLVRCINNSHRMAIIPLSLVSNVGGHANILVFDKELGEMERFEPHGKHTHTGYNSKLLDVQLQKFFNIALRPVLGEKMLKFIPPIKYCPLTGVQVIQQAFREKLGINMQRGLCSVWTFVYANYRLRFPNKSRRAIAHLLTSPQRGNLQIFAENIVAMLAEISERLRTARTEGEIEEILIQSTQKYGKNF